MFFVCQTISQLQSAQRLKLSTQFVFNKIFTEMDTNAGIEPMQMTEDPSTQTAGGTKPLHRFLRGEPKTVGVREQTATQS